MLGCICGMLCDPQCRSFRIPIVVDLHMKYNYDNLPDAARKVMDLTEQGIPFTISIEYFEDPNEAAAKAILRMLEKRILWGEPSSTPEFKGIARKNTKE